MTNNQNQPKQYDAVLGGNSPPPIHGAVLGGIEGVKKRLASSDVDVQISALNDALNYGDEGLDLVIQALENDSLQVKSFASRLLKESGGEKGKQALLEFDPYLYFTKLDDWEVEEFNPEVGIVNPKNKAYVVNLEKLQILIQDERVNEVEGLICYLHYYDYESGYTASENYNDFFKIVLDNCVDLENLKALFVGDKEINRFRESYVEIGNIGSLLKAYQNLEVLHIRGCCEQLEFEIVKHNNLKTLIIETVFGNCNAFERICSSNLPALEYFELWMGQYYIPRHKNIIDTFKPILFSESFPNLYYLGIRSSENADEIAEGIARFCNTAELPITDNLLILDLSMGNLTEEGLGFLLQSSAISNLHTLDISNNCVSEEFLEQVEQLSPPNYWLITNFQEEIIERGIGVSRYLALHE